jgi:MFS family permease|tara:strand:+ start:840 stop:2027 length:1188 start_codon:yes stop_codon:yes gene_type:complete
MHTEKKENLPLIDKLGMITLFSSIGLAAIMTIWAVYLDSFLHNASYVGFLTAFFIIIGSLSYIFFIPIIEKKNKVKLYLTILFLFTISYILFGLFSNLYAVIILGIITSILASLGITCLGIIVRDKTRDSSVSKNEGIIFTSRNIAFLLGPIIAGFIANKYGMANVFFFAAIAMFISLILFKLMNIQDNRVKKRVDKNSIKVFIDFFKKRERTLSYFTSGGITFWWALIYTYIPIYILNNDLGKEVIGYFLAAMTIPLILTEYSFGKLAGKIGFKKIFVLGYLIIGFFTILAFFFSNIYIVLALLILASFGAGMLEPTTEAYFFDTITKEQRDKFYGPYNTTINLNAFMGRVFAAILLLFLPFKFIFILFGITMFLFAIVSSKTKDIIESKKKYS